MYKNYNLISWQTFLIDKLYIDKRHCNRNRPCLRCVEIPKRSAGSTSSSLVCSYSLRFYRLLFLISWDTSKYAIWFIFASFMWISHATDSCFYLLYEIPVARACVCVCASSFIFSVVSHLWQSESFVDVLCIVQSEAEVYTEPNGTSLRHNRSLILNVKLEMKRNEEKEEKIERINNK